MRPVIVPLDNPVRNYAWGSRTAIGEMLGRPSPGGLPEAELWIGAHPQAPSRLALPAFPRTLDALVRRAPEAMLGPRDASRFGGELPLLLKVIAAAEPLSIQCHPDAAQARAGFARENAAGLPLDSPERCYRDPGHKPELVAALTRFVGLKGCRPRDDVRRLLAALGVPGLAEAAALLDDGDDLRPLFEWLWSRPAGARAALVGAAAAAAAARRGEDPAFAWMPRLATKYPADAGVLAPLLLNLVTLEPEDGLFLPAGELHAYLEGTAVEVMASSDNVLRGGLTPKHVDVAELLAVGVFRPAPPKVLRPVAVSRWERVYPAPAAEFELALLGLGGAEPFVAREDRGPELLLGLEGSATIAADGSRWPLGRGRSVFVPAAVRAYRIEGEGRVARARIPR